MIFAFYSAKTTRIQIRAQLSLEREIAEVAIVFSNALPTLWWRATFLLRRPITRRRTLLLVLGRGRLSGFTGFNGLTRRGATRFVNRCLSG